MSLTRKPVNAAGIELGNFAYGENGLYVPYLEASMKNDNVISMTRNGENNSRAKRRELEKFLPNLSRINGNGGHESGSRRVYINAWQRENHIV